MTVFPIPYQSPNEVVFGPFAGDNLADFALVQSLGWTSPSSSTVSDALANIYGIPFTLQSPVLAQKAFLPLGTISAFVTGPFGSGFTPWGLTIGVYDTTSNALQLSTLDYGLAYTGNPAPAGGNVAGPFFGFTSPKILNPGNYTAAIGIFTDGQGSGGVQPFYGSGATLPINTSAMLGIRQATSSYSIAGGLPSNISWTNMTTTLCLIINFQLFGVNI